MLQNLIISVIMQNYIHESSAAQHEWKAHCSVQHKKFLRNDGFDKYLTNVCLPRSALHRLTKFHFVDGL